MTKKITAILVVLLAVVVLCGCFNTHEHTFEQSWSYNEQNHFYKSTCGHDVVDALAPHAFDTGVENADGTAIIYTCATCQYQKSVENPSHVCVFEGEWIVGTPATIFTAGEEYRECSSDKCILRETRPIEKVAVVSIAVTTQPTKTTYYVGETFDATGIVVTATGADGSTANVTAYVTFDKTVLAQDDTIVTVSYGTVSTTIAIVVEQPTVVLSVSQARQSQDFESVILLKGYFVGLSDEGYNLTKEILLKDVNSDDVISVRNLPDSYGTWPNVGYTYGDKIQLYGTLVQLVYTETSTASQNKVYFDFNLDKNPSQIEQTILSQNNSISYELNNVVELNDWNDWKELFNPSTFHAYTYINISGTIYLNTYLANDDIKIVRICANGGATNLQGIKPDGVRALGFRETMLNFNLGEEWRNLFDYPEDSASNKFPGLQKTVNITAIVTTTNSVNYQLTVLCSEWVKVGEEVIGYTNQEILTEVAYAFYRQGTQAEYDMTKGRRDVNSSPEDATDDDALVLDCSSYANSVYYEAFGVNIMDNGNAPNTANFASYAKSYAGQKADVIGYWETANYTTEEERAQLLAELKANLQVGDCVVYRHGEKSPTGGHIMVYVGNNVFLHSTGTSYNYASDPTKSYDKATKDEHNIGTVQLLSADTVFDKNSSKRYLFYSTTSDTTYNFAILRPLNRNLTPTRETVGRMSLQGIDMEKYVSVGAYGSIYNNSTIEYKLRLTNTSSTELKNVNFKETLSNYCTFVSSNNGVVADGNNISWTGDVGANSTVEICYSVKVSTTDKQAQVVSVGTVNGVQLNTIYNTISHYTAEQMQAVAQTARDLGVAQATYENPIEFAKAVYKQALGVDLFGYSKVGDALADIIDTTGKTYRTDTDISHMIAGHLYGGLDIYAGYLTDDSRARLVCVANLAVGDVIMAEKGSSMVAIYLGDGVMVAIDSASDVCSLVENLDSDYHLSGGYYILDNPLAQLVAYNRYAVLRPGMVA